MTAMKHDIGLDVSLELTAVCVVNGDGEVIAEAKVLSEPDALVAHLQAQKMGHKSVGFDAVLLERRHVKAALSAMTVKTVWSCGGLVPVFFEQCLL